MNKKGFHIPIQIYVIGGILLVVVLVTTVPHFFKVSNETIFYKTGILDNYHLDDEHYTYDLLILPKAPEEARFYLALATFECWNFVQSAKKEKRICYQIDSSKLPKGLIIDKENFLKFFSTIIEPQVTKIVANILQKNENWVIPEKIYDFTPKFFVCSSYKSGIIFTNDITYCNKDIKPIPLTPFVLPSDKEQSSELITEALANCWNSIKKQDFQGICAYFDPKKLEQEIKKTEIKNLLSNQKEIIELSEAVKSFEKNTAVFFGDRYKIEEGTITKNTKPFYVCGTSNGNKLCLTHDLNNECCKIKENKISSW